MESARLPKKNNNTVKPRQAQLSEAKKAAVKLFRSQYAKLKKRGLVKGNARTVKPTKANRGLVAQFLDVLSGKARVTKVTPKQAAQLRQSGNTVRNGKLVTSKEYIFRNGKMFLAGKRGARLYPVDMARFDESVTEIFNKLKPRYGLAAKVYGRSTSQIYKTADLLIQAFQWGSHDLMMADKPVIELYDPKETFEAYHKKAQEARAERLMAASGKKGRAAKKERQSLLAAFRASLRRAS